MRKRLLLLVSFVLAICLQGGGWTLPVARSAAPAVLVPAVSVTVRVPADLGSAPFDVPRTLSVPRGFSIAVYARVPGARFMAITPDGNLLVSVPGNGKIVLVRARSAGSPIVSDFVTGLNGPQGMAFHTIGN